MQDTTWKSWEHDQAYGEVFYKRAIGELAEMESSKALCHMLARVYQPGLTVADVGCGAGHYLRSLRARVDAQINYTGIDATAYYIELARRAFPERADFLVGDIYDLPVEDAHYDIVVNNNVLLHLPPPPIKPLSELIRIAKKYVIIRTLVGQSNYIIKEVRLDKAGQRANEDAREYASVAAEADLRYFNYYNMYTARYFREAIQAIDPRISVEIIKDDLWQPFDDTALATQTGTQTVGNTQIAGNLLLDWHFLILTKAAHE